MITGRHWWLWLRWLLPAVIFIVLFIGLQFNAGWYHQPVARIESVRTTQVTHPVDNFENHDRQVTQRVRARLLNGTARGRRVTLTNTYTRSGAQDTPLRRGMQVFLTRAGKAYTVTNIKRDAVILALLGATLTLLGLIMGRHFWLTCASLVANGLVFNWALHVEIAHHAARGVLLFSLLVVAFAVITAVLVVGFRPLAGVIATATVLATGLGVALGYAIFTLTGYRNLHLEVVKYVTQSPHMLFFGQIVIGALGAVLDECTDIAVAVAQLRADTLTRFQTGMTIGRNVMGPLIAVLFMIFIAETFAEGVLWLRNGNAISQMIIWVMGLGFAQTLISAFGIVLAVPLTSGLAAVIGRKQEVAS